MSIFLIDTSATLVGIRDRFILDKMPPRRHPANEVLVEEVYECDHMMWLEQQVEVLTQQFQAFLANQNQQNHNPHGSCDDSPRSDDF